MPTRGILLMTLGVISCVLWAQSPSKPQPDKKPVVLQEVELPNGQSLRFWMKEILCGRQLGYVEIRGELVDPTTKAAKQLCSISYWEERGGPSHFFNPPLTAGPIVLTPPKKPPGNFVVAMKSSSTLGLAFTVYPYWAGWFSSVDPRDIDASSMPFLEDAAFLELDLRTEFRQPDPRDPTYERPGQAEKHGWYGYYSSGISLSISRLLIRHLRKSDIVKLLAEDKLRLKSLKYEKDRWILQGELGDHGFEITLRELVELTQAEAVRMKEPWRVIRWGDRPEPDPRVPPPLLVELNKVWRLR